MRPLSWLLSDRPCHSNCGTPAEDRLARTFQKILYVRVSTARPRHSLNGRFFPSLALKPSCCGVGTRVFCVSMTTGGSVCRPDWSRNWQRRSEWKHNHTNALATKTRSRKGGNQRVHAKQYTQRGVTLQNPLYNADRSIRTGRVPFTPIYLIPTLLELSGNIPLETSKNPGTFRTLLDYSGSF